MWPVFSIFGGEGHFFCLSKDSLTLSSGLKGSLESTVYLQIRQNENLKNVNMVSVAGNCFWVSEEFCSALGVAIWSHLDLLQTNWRICQEHGLATHRQQQDALCIFNSDLVEWGLCLPNKCCGSSLNPIRENDETWTSHRRPYLTNIPSSLPLKSLILQKCILLPLWNNNTYFVST